MTRQLPLRLDAAARTHRGSVRRRNEDAFVLALRQGRLAVVDGMGGEAAGDVAAGLTVRALERSPPVEGLIAANHAINTYERQHPRAAGMGCVATALQFDGASIAIGHVGDTRLYHADQTGVRRLTDDHRPGAAGLYAPNIVSRSVGGAEETSASWIDRATVAVELGDVLLLCSDGLHGVLSDGEISGHLADAYAAGTPVATVACALEREVLNRGAPDNVTTVVARVVVCGEGWIARALSRLW